MIRVKVKNSKLIKFKDFKDGRGHIFIGESGEHVPWNNIKRVFFVKNIPSSKVIRANHAHYTNEEILCCINGSFKIHLDDGFKKQTLLIKGSKYGIYLGPKLWRKITNFSKDCILFAISGNIHNPSDYIWDYKEFLKIVRSNKK